MRFKKITKKWLNNHQYIHARPEFLARQLTINSKKKNIFFGGFIKGRVLRGKLEFMRCNQEEHKKMQKKRYHTIHICTFMFRSSFSNVDNISILQRFIKDDKDYLGGMSNGIRLKNRIADAFLKHIFREKSCKINTYLVNFLTCLLA